MPIGLVSDDLLKEELDRCSGVKPNKSVVKTIEKPGRKDGDVNVPDSLRQLIGEEVLLNGREAGLNLAGDFGISASSVSAYTKGATSTASYDKPSKSIIGHINKARERAIKKASKTLNGALSAITQEKLDYADASDLSGIAKDMSVIIKNLEPKSESNESETKTGVQFVIFAPQFRKEESFDVIQVNE